MLMQNEFDGRDEVIFVEYDKVIKNSDQFLIQKLGGELNELYKPFLATEVLKDIDPQNALGLTMIMKHHNLFDSFRRGELPEGWIHSYVELYKAYPDMFLSSDLLTMGSSLYMLAAQKFTKKILVWSPFEDPRVVDDIVMRHGDTSKFEYVWGDLTQIFENYPAKITSFIIANSQILPYIKEYSRIDYSEVLLASYRFNMYPNESGTNYRSKYDDSYFEDKIVALSTFDPFKISERHLTKIIKKD